MREWHRQGGPERVGVLLFPRFSNLCLANAVEPLRAANEVTGRPLYDWEVLTLDGAPVASSSGLVVGAARRLRDHEGGATLIVLPSHDVRLHATEACARALRAAATRFGRLAGLDTGAWLLARAGLLDGRRATIHPDEATAFAEAFPEIDAAPERAVDDGPVSTCGGAAAALDWTLDRIGRSHGEATRLDVAALLLAPGIVRPMRGGGAVARCVRLMAETVERPLPLPEIAARAGVTPKRLARLVRAEFATTPAALYRRLRLAEARRLAEHSDHSVAEIALRCGYRDASALTRAYHAAFGTTPTGTTKRARAKAT